MKESHARAVPRSSQVARANEPYGHPSMVSGCSGSLEALELASGLTFTTIPDSSYPTRERSPGRASALSLSPGVHFPSHVKPAS
jgi:hypothetical protein